jgi:hypothetical protein
MSQLDTDDLAFIKAGQLSVYRKDLARNHICRFWLNTNPDVPITIHPGTQHIVE